MNTKIICNYCGKSLLVEASIIKEDFIEINKKWGYFSKKDGKTCKAIICENCADKLFATFEVPVEICDTIELL